MENSKELSFQPYARLLTMLGDQLIKNERIALIELIKNSYDADSSWVKVSFVGFDEEFRGNSASKIIIEDDGHGMSADVIENHWVKPATPEKKRQKAKNAKTSKGRVMQGEKGIGRFAVLKLGRKIKIITRKAGENVEHVVDFDFSRYDDEFLSEEGEEKAIFLDQLKVSLQTSAPEYIKAGQLSLGLHKFQRIPQGTRIEISNLKGSWSHKKVEAIYRDISRLEPIFPNRMDELKPIRNQNGFEVWMYKDEELQRFDENYQEKLEALLKERAVFRIENGEYDEANGEFKFIQNDIPKVLKLSEPKIWGIFVSRFGKGRRELENHQTACGDFKFAFYIFDFSPQAPTKYRLDKDDKAIIKEHRIYLYRDGIRVYPYGDPENDWLGIDIHRGTSRAAEFLSNDQVIGYIDITQEQNPNLKDKTNREGLLEVDDATDDFIALRRTILRYIRAHDYARYQLDLKSKTAHDIFRTNHIQSSFDALKMLTTENKKTHDLVLETEKEYKIERRYLIQRAETTEELAGVGLSVEAASHDIMAIMGKAMVNLDGLMREVLHDDLDPELLHKELESLRGMLSFIDAQLRDIQLLFKSSKQRRKNIRVVDIVEKVERIYRRLLTKENIDFVVERRGAPLIAKTTDAVLLQVLLNLLDNAVYWLKHTSKQEKRIEILLDGDRGQMIFSDNGPGVDAEDAPYIFEPFYSGKGEEGRGLGLYIARQLLERDDYSIELADLESEKRLSGANFVVNFIAEDS